MSGQHRDNKMLLSALWYARKGWQVIPLHSVKFENGVTSCTCRNSQNCDNIGKHPRWDRELLPSGLKSATTNEETIQAWWKKWPDANIGIVTGPESGLVVVDIDTKANGDASWEELIDKNGLVPETVEAVTGSGGRHIIFEHPGWYVPNSVGDREGKSGIAPGIDIRGDGGYFVASPSIHESGHRYEWEMLSRPESVSPAALPEWLADKIKTTVDRKSHEAKALTTGRVWKRYLTGPSIKEGDPGRDVTLFKIGCAMRSNGASHADILATLNAVNSQRCQPPMDYRTVLQKADQAAKYSPGKSGLLSFEATDLGNAERLVDRHGADLKYCPPLRGWLIWDGKRWSQDKTGEIYRRAAETVRAYRREAEIMLKKVKEEAEKAPSDQAEKAKEKVKAAEKIVGFAKSSEGKNKLKAMVELAEFQQGIPADSDDFDIEKYLLNVNNGTLDLRTGKLSPHRRENLITKLAPVDYSPNAHAPRWTQFLSEITDGDMEMIEYLQRKIGYTLSGDTSEEEMDVLYGRGGNGKSKFLEVIQELMGDYAQQAPTSLLMGNNNNGGPSPELVRLKGARFVATVETGEGKRMDEELVKQLTGRDRIAARHLYKDVVEFVPEAKIFLATNHKPLVRADDGGIWRRLKLIPFTVTIPEEKRDKHLSEKLKAEISGILTWAIQGFQKWKTDGLNPPAKVTAATDAYQAEMDSLGTFISDCCVEHPKAKSNAKNLYDEYVTWCQENGENPMKSRMFKKRLEERGFIYKAIRDQYQKAQKGWEGIGLVFDDKFPKNAEYSKAPSSQHTPAHQEIAATAELPSTKKQPTTFDIDPQAHEKYFC